MRKSEATRKLVSDFDKAGKPIAAICHGPWMMASCCDVKDKRLTSVPTIKDDLIHAGADWVNDEVVVSGNLITSRSPLDLPAFVKAFVGELQKK
jgi:protease I